jgi:hypothetical protein
MLWRPWSHGMAFCILSFLFLICLYLYIIIREAETCRRIDRLVMKALFFFFFSHHDMIFVFLTKCFYSFKHWSYICCAIILVYIKDLKSTLFLISAHVKSKTDWRFCRCILNNSKVSLVTEGVCLFIKRLLRPSTQCVFLHSPHFKNWHVAANITNLRSIF